MILSSFNIQYLNREEAKEAKMEVLTTILSLLVTISLIIITAKAIKGRQTSLPPGPRRLPLIGNLHQMGARPHESLSKLAQTHGDIMSLKLGQVTCIVITSASAARLVLQKHDMAFANRPVPDAMRACGHYQVSVVWRPLSSQWRELRRICITEIFVYQKLEAFVSLRQQKVDHLINDVSKSASLGKAVLIGEAAFQTMLSLQSLMLLSVDLTNGNSASAAGFKRSFSGILELGGISNWLISFLG